jgi:GxxExxY protein
MVLELERETFLLRRCFFEVQNEVGIGRQEEAYHQACVLWLRREGLPVVSKPPHRLMLRGEEAHRMFPDFVGWNAISVELKAVTRHLGRSDFVQLFDYLKCRRDRVGLLVNMGLDRVEIECVIYDLPQTEWVENWEAWTDRIDGDDRAVGSAIRAALQNVYEEHTTGYGTEVVERLVHSSLRQRGLSIVANPVAKAFFGGHEVHESPLTCYVVNERIVLTLSALFDTNDFNIHRGESYLKALGLTWGIAADFGKTRAEITGIRRGRRNA